jgi:hypothetical protein
VTRPVKAKGRGGSEDGPLFVRRNYVLMGIALVVIAAGFVTLAAGSITIAPILLVAGYAFLVPWALLARGRRGRGPDEASSESAKPGE